MKLKSLILICLLTFLGCESNNSSSQEVDGVKIIGLISEATARDLITLSMMCSDLSCLGNKKESVPQWLNGYSKIGYISLESKTVYKVWVRAHEHAYLALYFTQNENGFELSNFGFGELN